ncbi:MAG: phospholipase [Flavobacteriaceae bacterium]|nr:MAG: phospholipase [Flavobacteriaceae bacterium]
MSDLALEYIVREPKVKVANQPLLFMFHGYGSNEQDLFSFANELPDELLIISAQAPMSIGMGAYAWYTIHFDSADGKFSDIPEAIEARNTLATFITQIQEKYNSTPENTFLLGFSQGTILSYSIALNHPEKVKNIIALSGHINPDLMPDDLETKNYKHLDFFISHGSVDQVIPVTWANKAPAFLKQLHIKHCYQEYPVGHGVAPQNFYDLKQWVIDRLH